MRWTLLVTLLMSTPTLARADIAPSPANFEVQQDGADVRIQVDTCDDCEPHGFEIHRRGAVDAVVGALTTGEAEVLETWEHTWDGTTTVWVQIQIVDECVPAPDDPTPTTYDFIVDGDLDDPYHSAEVDIWHHDECQDVEPGHGAAPTCNAARPVAALPLSLGAFLILLGCVTLRLTNRQG